MSNPEFDYRAVGDYPSIIGIVKDDVVADRNMLDATNEDALQANADAIFGAGRRSPAKRGRAALRGIQDGLRYAKTGDLAPPVNRGVDPVDADYGRDSDYPGVRGMVAGRLVDAKSFLDVDVFDAAISDVNTAFGRGTSEAQSGRDYVIGVDIGLRVSIHMTPNLGT